MKDSQKDDLKTWTNDPSMAARYAPIHEMVTEALARIEPDGYAKMLEDLRAQHKPQSAGETHMLALLADLSWRIHGCFYLETEILKRGMEASRAPDDPPDQTLARVFIRETKAGGLLSKLNRYESRLSSEFSRCLRVMEMQAKNRKFAQARNAESLARLAKRKSCTSVIQ
jgi:hypothetical protein